MDVTCRRTYLADLMTVDLSVAEILESIKTNGTTQNARLLTVPRHGHMFKDLNLKWRWSESGWKALAGSRPLVVV